MCGVPFGGQPAQKVFGGTRLEKFQRDEQVGFVHVGSSSSGKPASACAAGRKDIESFTY